VRGPAGPPGRDLAVELASLPGLDAVEGELVAHVRRHLLGTVVVGRAGVGRDQRLDKLSWAHRDPHSTRSRLAPVVRHTAVVTLRTLVVMRHADAVPSQPGMPDVDRPLTPSGRRRAASRRPAVTRLDPDLVLCSAALRTRQTLEALGPLRGEVRVEAGVYEASGTSLLLRLGEIDDAVGTAMVIGHMPTVAEVVAGLLPADEAPVGFAPAAVVALGLPTPWAELRPGSATLLLRLP
jgi:phosphohistidine phosphatase